MTTEPAPLTDLEQRVIARIQESDWVSLTSEMVRTGQPHSVNPLDPDIAAGEEESIALFVAGKLEAMGFDVENLNLSLTGPMWSDA